MRRNRRVGLAVAAIAIGAVAFAVGAWVVVPLGVAKALDDWAAAAPGRAAAAGGVSVNPFTLTITLHEVALDLGPASVVADRAALDFGIASLFGSVAVLDELEVDAPRLRLGPDEGEPAVGAAVDLVPETPFAITRATVAGGRIEWLDERGAPLVLDGVSLAAFGVDNQSDAPARFELDIRDALGGVLRLEGEMVLVTRAGDGRMVLENVDAAPVAARLLASPPIAGRASGEAEFEWRGDAGSVRLRNAALRVLRPEIDWRSGGVLSAASLEAAGDAQLRSGVWRASLRTLTLAAPEATVVLNAAAGAAENRPLEAVLGMLLAPPIGVDDGVSSGDRANERPTLAAERVELEGGVIEIVDAGLEGARPSLRASNVTGVIERAEGEPGTIVADLEARVGDGGSAMLHARTAGREARTAAVALELRGLPSDAIAEHARRFAGYALEGGVVDAEIEYRIEPGGVDGNARVAVRGVEIDPVDDAADAEGFVPLALALLEDEHGGAETRFGFASQDTAAGIGRILAAAVLAQLEAVAAAPFVALAAASGVDAATLAAVSFPPGEAAPSEPRTIDALAQALRARPRVGLRVQGVADRELDRDALAAQQVELHVALATAGPTVVARPQPVDFASPRHRDIIEEFAGERLGAEQRETIASYFTRTPEGRVVESEQSAYYRALFDALVENETIPQNGIERLGRYRARAIADALTAQGVPEGRVEIAPAIVRSGSAASTSGAGTTTDAPGDDGPAADQLADERAYVDLPLEVFVLPSGAADRAPAAASPPATDSQPATESQPATASPL